MQLKSKLIIMKNPIYLAFSSFRYLFIFALASFLMLSFSLLILNISLIFDPISKNYTIFERALLLFNLLGGLFTNNTLFTSSLLIITSVLAGLNISLLTFKLKAIKNLNYKEGAAGTSGTIAGIFASGCSSCGISVLSVIGLAGFVTFLPFEGIELSILSIILLLFSIYWTSKGISKCEACKV